MAHTIEPAASGRSRCRACARTIARGELRLGERLPNPFADEGEHTLWFHLACGAYKRPEALLEALAETTADVERRGELERTARTTAAHRRLPRIDGAERSPTSRASCRACRDKIPKGSWRIRLAFFEESRFAPSGFVHVACAEDYFGTADVLDRLLHFSPELAAEDRADLERALGP